MRLDDIVQLPGAGAALLVLHRWLQREGITDRTAFDLLDFIGRAPPLAGEAGEVVTMLERDDEAARAAIGLLNVMVKIERLEALAKSLGAKVEISDHLAHQFEELQRRLNGEGGAA